MEEKRLEIGLPDQTKIVWRFAGEVPCACLREIRKVMTGEDDLEAWPTATTVLVRHIPPPPGLPPGWRREEQLRRTGEAAVRRTAEQEIELLLFLSPPNDLRPLLPRIIWYGFLPRLLRRELVVVHGALLARNGRGIVISGPSGAGKSTCAERIPLPWRALCDDAVLISRTGNLFYAQPLPTWSQLAQETPNAVSLREPVTLSAICYLSHAEQDRVKPLPVADQIQMLYRQFYDLSNMWRAGRRNALWRNMNEAVIDFAVDLSRKVPIRKLECSRNGKFWNELEELL